MLKRLLMINSANFQFADIDLSKEVFFVGDNASGKTTSTRALHFLYNGDGQQLGIPHSKDSFAKHYFPHDDSYIIYVFETFFIFTYKRNDTIRRWFSKNKFEIDSVIKNGKLLAFKEIETYVKSASLHYKPQTIEEYTLILYGNDKKYLDFSIAKIENYKTFLDVFNMIFNIDKAIVTSSDIKRAIQKSLDRKDETLILDYDDFIRKLNGFSKSYHFFKTFDANRVHLQDALSIKDELIALERASSVLQKAISYRFDIEVKELNVQKEQIDQITDSIREDREKIKKFGNRYEDFDRRISRKIQELNKEVAKLESLKDEFDPLNVEDNTLLANRYQGIKKEIEPKRFSLQQLKAQQSTAQQEIKSQIEQIEYKIKTTIPNETNQMIYSLSDIERTKHSNEAFEIEAKFLEQVDEINKQTNILKNEKDVRSNAKSALSWEVETEQQRIIKEYNTRIVPMDARKKADRETVDTIADKIRSRRNDMDELNQRYREHEKIYEALRKSNAKTLADIRAALNNRIFNMQAIINPHQNSFHEFLANEIDGWEQDIYPIIDKNLLRRSRDELHPEIIDGNGLIGFKVDTSSLETIPTKDEALHMIKKTRFEKAEQLKFSKEVYKAEIAKWDEKKNELLASIESCDKEIDNLIDEKAVYQASVEKTASMIDSLLKEQGSDIVASRKKLLQKKEAIGEEINKLDNKIKELANALRELGRNKKKAVDDSAARRDFNINLIKSREDKNALGRIKSEQSTISTLITQIKLMDEDDMIFKLEDEVRSLELNLQKSDRAIVFLQDYEKAKNEILKLPKKETLVKKLNALSFERKALIKKIGELLQRKINEQNEQKTKLEEKHKQYSNGIKKVQDRDIEVGEEKLESEELLTNLVDVYIDSLRDYRNKKSKFRELIDKLKKLETHSLIELNFNMDSFSEAGSISELENILDSLKELANFERNKYESEKKRSHNNFDSFLRNTIPSKLQSFDDLENEFEKAKVSINKNLSNANFEVIRDIKLITDSSKKRNDSIATLLQDLSKKVQDTVGLYSSKSLFYLDVPKSVGNIDDIQRILEEIKKKGASGPINLFDTIDLSISYIENGKKVENKLNIKDESSSGGNILLKVAIAMSILNRFAKKAPDDTPFFLIIDEISKLQSKNQTLIRQYINKNGFKTLFITPDPAYPDPEQALFYTFKNIHEEGETLEIMQMNII